LLLLLLLLLWRLLWLLCKGRPWGILT